MPDIVWTGVGALAALLTSLGFLPQVVKMWQRRSVGDVSVLTFAQFTLGVALWTIYGLYIHDTVVVIANLVTLVTLMCGLLSYWHFRRSPGDGTPCAEGSVRPGPVMVDAAKLDPGRPRG